MEGKTWAVLVELGGMYGNNGGRKQIKPILIANAAVEAVKSSAVVGPVADSDDAFAAEFEFLAAGKDIDWNACGTTMKIEVALPKVEHIAHVGLNHMSGQ